MENMVDYDGNARMSDDDPPLMAAPSSSAVFNGPVSGSRRRGRNASACSQCHTRKQKCNGDQPCLNCVRRGVGHLCSGPPSSARGSRVSDRPSRPRSQMRPSSPPTEIPPPPSDGDTNMIGPNFSSRSQSHQNQHQPRIGQLWRSRGAPAFFGNSYFGPQVAATMLDSPAPVIPAGTGTGSSRKAIDVKPFRDESGPFSQIWDLLGLLPRRKSAVDHLVDRFFDDVNGDIDAVHEPSFRKSYTQFWERKSGFDDVTTVDLRWLALLFVILAMGAYLDCPHDSSPDTEQDYEDASLRFYWASRRAIVLAPSFYGESTDLVRAGVLITRYLIQTQRLAESWLTVGFASRLGIAQGLHVDGEKWRLPRRSTETRRRLWCQLYTLDRMISLALGRPYAIADAQTLLEEPQNVFVDDLTDEEAASARPLPLSEPTVSVMAFLGYRLAQVVGQIQEACFQHHTASYRDVLALDEKLTDWKNALPPYFAVNGSDRSLDESHPFLPWQRLYLHTSFHFARLTLHRPYLLRHSMTDRYQFSRDACLSSARADLKARLDHHSLDRAKNYTWNLGAHQLCNSAIILGVLAVKEANSLQMQAVTDDLEAYCELQRSQMWLSEFGLAEITVVEMCIAKLKQQQQQQQQQQQHSRGTATAAQTRQQSLEPNIAAEGYHYTRVPENNTTSTTTATATHHPAPGVPNAEPVAMLDAGQMPSPSGPDRTATPFWQDQMFPGVLPGFTDLQAWQEVIDTIGEGFSYNV